MNNFRRLLLLAAASATVLFSLAMQAATTELRVLFDVDNKSATGCAVSGLAGVDQVLVTQVTDDGTAARVTQTHRRLCAGGQLGQAVDVNASGWAAGLDSSSGGLIVETRVPFTAFGSGGMPQPMRVALAGTRDAADFAALSQDGHPILFPGGPAGRRRAAGKPGPMRIITLDGQGADWSGIPAIAQNSGASGIRLVRAFAFADPNGFLYFRFDLDLSHVNEVPVAADDATSMPEDGSVSVAVPGVLANDSDADVADTLTALLVSAPSHAASFALQANGSYQYTPQADFNGSDSFTYVANDGTTDSNTVTVTLTVTAVNDPPSFAGGVNQTADEDEGGQAVAGWATNMRSGPANELAQSVTFAAVGNTNAALFTSGGQPAVLPNGTLTYTPAPDANGSATITVRAVDDGPLPGSNISPVDQFTITVNAVNDPPVVGVSPNLTYVEGHAEADETVTVVDIDDEILPSATVQITGNYVPPEDALGYNFAFGIVGAFEASTGILSLTGPASPANFQAAMRSVIYFTWGDTPSTVTRTLTWTVNDATASGTDTSTVTVIPVNLTPILSAGGTLNYTENDPPTVVDPSVQATDGDGLGYVGATVQLTANYAQGQDVLSFVPADGITASFDVPSGTLTMTGFAHKGAWITALKNVLYHNTSETPTTAPRTVVWQTNDGETINNLSNVATSTINVIAVVD